MNQEAKCIQAALGVSALSWGMRRVVLFSETDLCEKLDAGLRDIERGRALSHNLDHLNIRITPEARADIEVLILESLCSQHAIAAATSTEEPIRLNQSLRGQTISWSQAASSGDSPVIVFFVPGRTIVRVLMGDLKDLFL